jgi:hypothetical protein
MTMIKCPCKDCKKRMAYCHCKCEDYKQYRVKLDEIKKLQTIDAHTSYIINSIQRRKKIKNEKNHS